MALAFRCIVRIVVGTLFGLAPAAIFFVYERISGYSTSSVFHSRLTALAGIGGSLGLVWGMLWALVLIEAQLDRQSESDSPK